MNGAVGKADIQDYYLLPWEAAVTRAGVRSIMCAYPSVNGVPSCGSKELLTDIARNTWKISGCT